MALLTPDLWEPWPRYPAIYFFVAHGGIVVGIAVLVLGRLAPLRQGAVWRAFGMLLASVCRTRAQLGALSTLVILIMSSVGGSMFPRFLMPETMQKAGLLTINAWAIDGFTKVFWRDEPLSHLWPQVLVLVAVGAVLFAIARRAAHRWEIV